MNLKARLMYRDSFGSIGIVFDVNKPPPGHRPTDIILFGSIPRAILDHIKEHEKMASEAMVDIWDADAADEEPVQADEFKALIRVGQVTEQKDGAVRVLLRVRPIDKKLARPDGEMIGDPVLPEDLE